MGWLQSQAPHHSAPPEIQRPSSRPSGPPSCEVLGQQASDLHPGASSGSPAIQGVWIGRSSRSFPAQMLSSFLNPSPGFNFPKSKVIGEAREEQTALERSGAIWGQCHRDGHHTSNVPFTVTTCDSEAQENGGGPEKHLLLGEGRDRGILAFTPCLQSKMSSSLPRWDESGLPESQISASQYLPALTAASI